MEENANLRPVYVTKADMALSQLTSGGKLVAAQEQKFFLVAIKKAVMLPRVFTTTVDRDQKELPKMTTFGSQVWYPATEMEDLAYAQRSRPGYDKVEFTTHEIMCQVNFARYFLRAQVEREGFQNTLIAYLGLHSARDFDNLVINGDTNSSNSLLALLDGMIAAASSNEYPASGGSLSSEILDGLMLTMPEEYADQDNLGFFTCRGARAAYRRELQNRPTPAGDKATTDAYDPTYDGIPVTRVPLFPTTLSGDETVVLHLNPKMFLYVIEEGVELETEYYKKARMWSIIMTARVSQTYQHEPAVAYASAVLAS